MNFMYILECADGSFYTGSTRNLVFRLWQHENGIGANHTSKRLPIRPVYVEEYQSISDAFIREKQIQGWSRAKKKVLIEGENEKLPKLAKKVFRREALASIRPFGPTQPTEEARTTTQSKEGNRVITIENRPTGH